MLQLLRAGLFFRSTLPPKSSRTGWNGAAS